MYEGGAYRPGPFPYERVGPLRVLSDAVAQTGAELDFGPSLNHKLGWSAAGVAALGVLLRHGFFMWAPTVWDLIGVAGAVGGTFAARAVIFARDPGPTHLQYGDEEVLLWRRGTIVARVAWASAAKTIIPLTSQISTGHRRYATIVGGHLLQLVDRVTNVRITVWSGHTDGWANGLPKWVRRRRAHAQSLETLLARSNALPEASFFEPGKPSAPVTPDDAALWRQDGLARVAGLGGYLGLVALVVLRFLGPWVPLYQLPGRPLFFFEYACIGMLVLRALRPVLEWASRRDDVPPAAIFGELALRLAIAVWLWHCATWTPYFG